MASLLILAIPFLFVLAIVYGALDVSNVFKNKGAKGIIAIVIAFFAISSQELVDFINSILPFAVILFIIVFFIAFVMALFKEKEGKKGVDYTMLTIIAALVLIFLANELSVSFIDLENSNLITIIGFVFILLIFFAAYKQQTKPEKQV